MKDNESINVESILKSVHFLSLDLKLAVIFCSQEKYGLFNSIKTLSESQIKCKSATRITLKALKEYQISLNTK